MIANSNFKHASCLNYSVLGIPNACVKLLWQWCCACFFMVQCDLIKERIMGSAWIYSINCAEMLKHKMSVRCLCSHMWQIYFVVDELKQKCETL